MRENLLTYTSQLLHKQLPFLILRKDNGSDVLLLHQRDQNIYNKPHDTMSHGIFSKFQNKGNQVFIYGEIEKHFTWSIEPFRKSESEVQLSKAIRKEHENRVKNAVIEIGNTELDKIVLSLKHTLDQSRPAVNIFSRLLDSYTNANCYFFYHPKVGTWMGATPETLLSYKNGTARTMSLAGTQKADSIDEIQWGNKELEEQQLVTNFISSTLKKVSNNNVILSPVETINAGRIFHLRTSIETSIEYSKVAKLVKDLHPTPAVCGLPRAATMDYILEHENYDRSFYTGYLGIQNPMERTADYYVNLRCMELSNQKVHLFAGGGITLLSVPADEVKEVENKLGTIASIL